MDEMALTRGCETSGPEYDLRDVNIPTPPPTPAVGKLSYKISIEGVANGFIARVGCQTFVFSNLRDMLEALELYYTDPDAATKKYLIGDKK